MSVQFCCLARSHDEIERATPTFVHYTPKLAVGFTSVTRAGVVLGAESEATAMALLNAGISKVFVGEAAVRDASVMNRLLKRFGGARLGLHVSVARQAVSWSFDTDSNADFSVVTPSLCAPAWEVLRANGEPAGLLADGWIDQMVRHGVQSVLLRVDIRDDADLNLCAGMVELLGDKLWLGPLTDRDPAITDWIRYGQATQLALPAALYGRRDEWLPRANNTDTLTAVA